MIGKTLDRVREIVDGVFRRITVADSLLAERMCIEGDAGARARLAVSFRLLGAPQTMPALLFPVHVKELLDRVVADEDTRPGTDAEIITAMSELSLRAPPSRAFLDAMAHLVVRHFQDRTDLSEGLREEYPGARAEIVEAFRRRLTVESRRGDWTTSRKRRRK